MWSLTWQYGNDNDMLQTNCRVYQHNAMTTSLWPKRSDLSFNISLCEITSTTFSLTKSFTWRFCIDVDFAWLENVIGYTSGHQRFWTCSNKYNCPFSIRGCDDILSWLDSTKMLFCRQVSYIECQSVFIIYFVCGILDHHRLHHIVLD